MLSEKQRTELAKAVRTGLSVLHRAPPVTGVEWADEHFYLSPESSYIDGKWETVPNQVAILNAMTNDGITEFNWVKSARVGYTKCIVAAIGYFLEHKKRNLAIWQPDDAARDRFSKKHVDPMIRDVSAVRELFPWLSKKHKNNTIESKTFSNGRVVHLLGGKAAKNYREISVDAAFYDELSKFDLDVEGEGTPTFLGDKRLEGSAFGKSIRGSTPGVDGECHISLAAEQAEHYFERYVPCPHCGTHQTLKLGGKDLHFGLKWDHSLPPAKRAASVRYQCEACEELFDYSDFKEADRDGYWESRQGLRTWDGVDFYHADSGEIAPTPASVAFHLWAVYSHFSPWSRIVSDWYKAQRSRKTLKSFTNTTLGEAWIEDDTRLDYEQLLARREHYKAPVPIEDCVLTAAVDTQDDRFEVDWVAWIDGEESFRISYRKLYGNLGQPEIWDRLEELLNRQFRTPEGVMLRAQVCMIDSGGHYTSEVYRFCRRQSNRFFPIKGFKTVGHPVIKTSKKLLKGGVRLINIGTGEAKSTLYDRLKILKPGPGYWHWPVSQEFEEEYFRMVTAEDRVPTVINGTRTYKWDNKQRRNEAWDTAVYNLAGIRLLQQNYGLVLDGMGRGDGKRTAEPSPEDWEALGAD